MEDTSSGTYGARDRWPAWCCDGCEHARLNADPLWFDFYRAAADAGTLDERRLERGDL